MIGADTVCADNSNGQSGKSSSSQKARTTNSSQQTIWTVNKSTELFLLFDRCYITSSEQKKLEKHHSEDIINKLLANMPERSVITERR